MRIKPTGDDDLDICVYRAGWYASASMLGVALAAFVLAMKFPRLSSFVDSNERCAQGAATLNTLKYREGFIDVDVLGLGNLLEEVLVAL